ncbi:unnamed protein product [Prunus armeniaca]|uniref:Jacalin-type lectin domain-containing protein n=1 Tax=Prunus armeniaca TaxID=36596 RepID=A0A6J5UDY6_PRUAR|nr:unnamed protein product [Prunus armeniaca]
MDGKERASGKKMTIVIGPWGGNGGADWDDGIYNGVREIKIAYCLCIDSITVVYDRNGKPVKAETRMVTAETMKLLRYTSILIKLQYPDEYLVGASGHYCPMMFGIGPRLIRSLKFQSNRRTFGPYGIEEGTPFTFTVDGGKIVGLKGRSGWYLDAIGFHVSPPPTKKLFQSIQKSFRRLGCSVSKP